MKDIQKKTLPLQKIKIKGKFAEFFEGAASQGGVVFSSSMLTSEGREMGQKTYEYLQGNSMSSTLHTHKHTIRHAHTVTLVFFSSPSQS